MPKSCRLTTIVVNPPSPTFAIEAMIESYQNKKRLELMRHRGIWEGREDILD